MRLAPSSRQCKGVESMDSPQSVRCGNAAGHFWRRLLLRDLPRRLSVPWSPRDYMHQVRCRYPHTCMLAQTGLAAEHADSALPYALLVASMWDMHSRCSKVGWFRDVSTGMFQPEPGQFGCLSCDILGDFFQEEEGKTSCLRCSANTTRYFGVLSAVNRSACQCKAGA
jgi:hypothetical protein